MEMEPRLNAEITLKDVKNVLANKPVEASKLAFLRQQFKAIVLDYAEELMAVIIKTDKERESETFFVRLKIENLLNVNMGDGGTQLKALAAYIKEMDKSEKPKSISFDKFKSVVKSLMLSSRVRPVADFAEGSN